MLTKNNDFTDFDLSIDVLKTKLNYYSQKFVDAEKKRNWEIILEIERNVNDILINAHNWRSILKQTPWFTILKEIINPCDVLLKSIKTFKRNYYNILENTRLNN